ncbi:tRNA-dihydrouridine(20) synthase [NAD(P)+] [Lachnellula suecica]|uniref:tRNA-dihydrouridine(20) synthase [NAD(P)+] n=1 Tax=Lachnellula suecica TaxID=602035 RepID=A0A8T9BTR7_9HELO|nr:tRNA-dihydrouridine(20) synthase [NAD(P)+] [Lachnellula suecica]
MTSVTKRVPIPPKGVDYRGKLVLAPMVRSGELPSRLLALHYGADLVWGPETVDRSMIGTTRKVNEALGTIDFSRLPSNGSKDPRKDQKESLIYRLHPEREGKRLIFQIGTSDPERAVQAARIVAGDVAGIDVNAGCPKPFSTSGGMGAALLQMPENLAGILEALVKEITPEFEIGISVKIRLLETRELTEALVRRLCATGITGLTIHCRTTPMRPRERAIREQLKMIADICRETGVACLMNGDVATRTQALELISEFGVDGAMIATAAESNSSCFRSEAEGGVAPWAEVVEQYIKTAMEVENRWGNTKYLLTHMIPGKLTVYREMTSAKSYHQACKILGLEHLEAQAKEIDEKLNITPDTEYQGRKGKKNKSAMAAGGNRGGNQNKNRHEGKKNLAERGVQNQPAVALNV